jgi:hypothetical protein
VKPALFSIAVALTLGAAAIAPSASSAASSDHRTFDGTVVHVSDANIKVQGIEGGKMQTLSFLIDSGSKIRKALRPNEYVKVTYDQKLLGIRHADQVDPEANPALKMKS